MSGAVTKQAIREFYDLLSPHFHALWGVHIHDGLYLRGDETKEEAQEALVRFLVEKAEVRRGSRVLDVGCGIGGTSIWLARNLGCDTTGITLSPVQVDMARRLAAEAGVASRFLLMDAEEIALEGTFDALWMVGVLGHLPDQRAFVARSGRLLASSGRFVLGDWVSASALSERDRARYVEPVLRGMRMPEIFPLEDYVRWFEEDGYRVRWADDLTRLTVRTWDDGISIVKARALFALARALGRDTVSFVRSIRAMKLAMKRGKVAYGALVAERL